MLKVRSPREVIDELSGDQVGLLIDEWAIRARDDQLTPRATASGERWNTWLLLGGRGAGKTRAGAEWVRAMVCGETPLSGGACRRVALVAENLSDARDIMVEGESGLLAIHRGDWRPVFETSKRRLTWPNGAIAQLFSAGDPESLRGPQFDAAWCDELCKWLRAEAAWDMLRLSLRLGRNPQTVVTTTPRPIPLLKRIMADPLTVVSRAGTFANAANLAPGFLRAVTTQYAGTRLGRQELDGEIIEDNPHALWRRPEIDRSRKRARPALRRIVVAVDPPATSGPDADACGIVVAGLGADEDAYVLDDRTVEAATPGQWAAAAVAAYHAHEADVLVAEVNQGGDMVRTIIDQIDGSVAYRAVRASRGKWVRAEPVAALYEQGRVHHVGVLRQLEDQMCDFSDGTLSGRGSPDRVDALVWALTHLMLDGEAGVPKIRQF